LIPKPSKDIIRNQNYRPIFMTDIDAKNPKLNKSKPNPRAH
jgi:hypothetical protein